MSNIMITEDLPRKTKSTSISNTTLCHVVFGCSITCVEKCTKMHVTKSILPSLLTAILSFQKEWGTKEGTQINQGNWVGEQGLHSHTPKNKLFSCQFIYVENNLFTICSMPTVKNNIQAKDDGTHEWSLIFGGTHPSHKYELSILLFLPAAPSKFDHSSVIYAQDFYPHLDTRNPWNFFKPQMYTEAISPYMVQSS